MGFWKQSKNDNAQDASAADGAGASSGSIVPGPSQDILDKYGVLLKRYNAAADDFKNTVSAAKEICKNSTAELEYLEGIVNKYNATNTLIQGYGDKINTLTDSMEQTILLGSMENSINTLESCCKEIQKRSSEQVKATKGEGFSLFAGCDTVEKLKRRYKELSKNYHPDTGSGDKNAMQEINSEYERLLKAFEVLK